MARYLYSFFFSLALPLLIIRLLWLSRHDHRYRQHLKERFGHYHSIAFTHHKKCIWIHAVSVGETQAILPLIRQLAQRYPEHFFVITHTTPTGRVTAQIEICRILGNRYCRVYIPYDKFIFIRKFLNYFQPQVAIFVETEIWPNVLLICEQRGIPSVLINARLSNKSHHRALRFHHLMRSSVARFSFICAQTQEDAQRFLHWSNKPVYMTGNLKFDYLRLPHIETLGQSWTQLVPQRKIICFASSRDHEEQMLLDALIKNPLLDGYLLLVIPRHPTRFDAAFQLFQKAGLSVVRRSSDMNSSALTKAKIVIGDSMGEMAAYYIWADIVLMGGSFASLGGQNLLEAIMQNTLVIVGPHTFNFSEITTNAIKANLATRVNDMGEGLYVAYAYLKSGRNKTSMNDRAAQFIQQYQGASAKTIDYLSTLKGFNEHAIPEK